MRTMILLSAAMVLLWTPCAEAHARLIRAAPRVGATVKASPSELRLLFSERIVPARSSVALSGPDGRPVALGPISVDPKDHRVVVAAVPRPLAPGAYRVAWDMTSEDTHETNGDFVFRIRP
jgi:hypothetical protein